MPRELILTVDDGTGPIGMNLTKVGFLLRSATNGKQAGKPRRRNGRSRSCSMCRCRIWRSASCVRLRRTIDVPIVLLSCKDSEIDKENRSRSGLSVDHPTNRVQFDESV